MTEVDLLVHQVPILSAPPHCVPLSIEPTKCSPITLVHTKQTIC